ncbi:hypothetical protein BaRGS_00022304 [Batillaria attramentaria]|uniref:Transporter n=1 Tax=Batillaria attramentaria TaxID=370345 RepID=A0ABD0KGY8_9CAEN
MLACIGGAVGFGNIWRFPYLCYRNGGGAFLLPYFICIVIIGVPLLFLETALGQFMRRGVVGIWNICPLFKGLGVSTVLYGLLQSIYYNVIMTWVGYYFVMSFFPKLPWAQRKHGRDAEICVESSVVTEPENRNASYNATSYASNASYNDSLYAVNASCNTNTTHAQYEMDSASEFWWKGVLELSDGLEETGSVCLHLLASLAVVWIVSYFLTWKGIRWSGKVVYFTATFPYVLMLVLLMQSALQPGAGDGIVFYLRPRFEALGSVQVWFEAASQVLFSYAVALGIWPAFGSYCPFNSNCYRNSLIVSACNSLTSFLSGFVVFTMLGHMAHLLQQPIDSVATSGLEGVMTALMDIFPPRLRRRECVLAVHCIVSFLLGISMITQGGMYVFQLVDYYLFGAFVPQVLCLLQVIAVAMVYGYRINPWMKVSWLVLTPLSLLMIMGFQLASFKPLTYNKTYVYPDWANVLGYIMTAAVIAIIPVYAVIVLIGSQGSILERLRKTTQPRITHNSVPSFDLKDDGLFGEGCQMTAADDDVITHVI